MPKLITLTADLGIGVQYNPEGTITTKMFDLGGTPTTAGTIRLAFAPVSGTEIAVSRSRGSADGIAWDVWADAGLVELGGRDWPLHHTPRRYVEAEIELTTTDTTVTPVLDAAMLRAVLDGVNWNEGVWT